MEEIQYGPFLEQWKKIKEYPDYDISNYGRVKSFKNNKEVILKLQKIGKNKEYLSVKLSNIHNTKRKVIHRLVGQYIPNPYNLEQINHKNGNGFDNHHLNLEWCSNRENNCHRQDKTKTSSQYIGVSWHKKLNKWCARINIKNKCLYLGSFDNELTAHQARCNYEQNNNIINKYLI